jgi:hypothetical protein
MMNVDGMNIYNEVESRNLKFKKMEDGLEAWIQDDYN